MVGVYASISHADAIGASSAAIRPAIVIPALRRESGCRASPEFRKEIGLQLICDLVLVAIVIQMDGVRSRTEVFTEAGEQGVAAGVVQSAAALAQDPQLKSRRFLVELSHPDSAKTVSDASPIRLSATPPGYNRPAPLPGQDNDYVYGELLGLSEREMAELKKQKVI